MITEPAPAKINLALHIRAKRPDGYHDLETLFAFARDGDVVTIEAADHDSFTISGPFAEALNDDIHSASRPDLLPGKGRGPVATSLAGKNTPPLTSAEQLDPGLRRGGIGAGTGVKADNLVTRARDRFRATFGAPPVAISLEKNLPIASGIGGGSADAAATLRALARLTDVDLADSRLDDVARSLGADVPACLLGGTAFATGRGDDLTPLSPLGALPLLLINPRVPLSTATMFASWDGTDRGGIATSGDALERAGTGRNDFTDPAVAQAPIIASVLSLLDTAPGCTFARLSGSGATCFGLFDGAHTRDSAAREAAANGWWALATTAR